MKKEDAAISSLVNAWTYNHLVAFLLLYASYADYEYSIEEREHILQWVDPDVLEDVEKAYHDLGDYQHLDLIVKLKKKHINTPDQRSGLFTLLESHFSSDGSYSRPERALLKFLHHLL